jgi:hypothetical protein
MRVYVLVEVDLSTQIFLAMKEFLALFKAKRQFMKDVACDRSPPPSVHAASQSKHAFDLVPDFLLTMDLP